MDAFDHTFQSSHTSKAKEREEEVCKSAIMHACPRQVVSTQVAT
jgi:hypothetical protein